MIARLAARLAEAPYAVLRLSDHSVTYPDTAETLSGDAVAAARQVVDRAVESASAAVYPDLQATDDGPAAAPLRFGAVVPIQDNEGVPIGALGVFDTETREDPAASLDDALHDLAGLAAHVVALPESMPPNQELGAAMLANITHELRSPLTSIKGFADLLKRTDSEDRRNEYANRIYMAARQANATIDQLLRFQRLESGTWAPSADPVNLTDLAHEVVDLLRPQASDSDLGLYVVTPKEPVRARLDGDAVRYFLRNLVDNAIKYTEPGGDVTVALEVDDDGIHLDVTDDGIGIDPEFQGQIFEPFARENRVQAEGSGLGLAITKRLIDAMGGTITIDSAPGEGTRFSIVLPQD